MNYLSIVRPMQSDFDRIMCNLDNGSDVLSSGMLSSVDRYLVPDTSGQISVPIFKLQALSLERLTLRDGTTCCPENSVTK
jgi:hypothetical protein